MMMVSLMGILRSCWLLSECPSFFIHIPTNLAVIMLLKNSTLFNALPSLINFLDSYAHLNNAHPVRIKYPCRASNSWTLVVLRTNIHNREQRWWSGDAFNIINLISVMSLLV